MQRSGCCFCPRPFSFEAMELLDCIGTPAWKVGSGEVTNHPLIGSGWHGPASFRIVVQRHVQMG
ncbi:MAG: N-acetylneuraminate synthase family protein [Chloracidobacterium sp.]|nr:N-acetylneuraminate synthase family protein [Chloracidobacterium sp.]